MEPSGFVAGAGRGTFAGVIALGRPRARHNRATAYRRHQLDIVAMYQRAADLGSEIKAAM